MKDIKKPNLTRFIICKSKLQVDPRPGHAQRQLQTLHSVKLTETTVQPVSGPGFQLPITEVSYSCKMTWCNHCTASRKAFSKLEGEKNSTNRFTEHSEKLSLNASLKTQSSSTNSRWIGFEEKTALFTVSKRKYHCINPDFDHLLLHISYEVNYFIFFK